MIQIRDLHLSPYVFQLQYFTDKAIGADINKDNCEGIIEVIYKPITPISRKEVDQIFKEKEPELLRLITVAIETNKKFYSQFKIPLKLNRTTYLYENNLVTTDRVISASSFLKITMNDNK